MSVALINRSLTNVRTELEFLYDSEVIDKQLYETLMESLPRKYSKDMTPWTVEKIPSVPGGKTTSGGDGGDGGAAGAGARATADEDKVSESLQKVSLRDELKAPSEPLPAVVPVPQRMPAPALGYCKASFNYDSSESGDLKLVQGDLLAVVEHLSPDWWRGYKKGSSPAEAGVFPSNYVTVVSETEFNASSVPEKAPAPVSEKASYNPAATPAPPMYQQATNNLYNGYQPGYQQGYQPVYNSPPPSHQQPSYGGYAQFPPPTSNSYGQQQMQPYEQPQQPPQQQQPQQEVAPQGGSNGAHHFKKFGSKLGNAAIFGAGATIGSDIVNLIF